MGSLRLAEGTGGRRHPRWLDPSHPSGLPRCPKCHLWGFRDGGGATPPSSREAPASLRRQADGYPRYEFIPRMAGHIAFQTTIGVKTSMPMVQRNLFRSWVPFGSPKGQEVVATLDGWIRGTPRGSRDGGHSAFQTTIGVKSSDSDGFRKSLQIAGSLRLAEGIANNSHLR